MIRLAVSIALLAGVLGCENAQSRKEGKGAIPDGARAASDPCPTITYTQRKGTLAQFRQDLTFTAEAMQVTFGDPVTDDYWIMFDGTNSQGGVPANNYPAQATNSAAEFELFDGNAYVKTTSRKLIPRPWPIIVTQHLIIGADGTEFVVRNSLDGDIAHNYVKVVVLDGTVVLKEIGKDNCKLVHTGKMLTAAWDGQKVVWGNELPISTTDAVYTTVRDRGQALCK
jgi:hypothetical protein